jgi:hypothetical protein
VIEQKIASSKTERGKKEFNVIVKSDFLDAVEMQAGISFEEN